MKTLTKLALLLFMTLGMLSASASAQNIGYSNYCMTGATAASVSGLKSTNLLQASYPSCTVTVFIAGTTTPATLFSNAAGATLSNPFTATTSGLFTFYAVAGAYDITLSGGTGGGFPAPVTIPFVTLGGSGGGGGGGGGGSPPSAPVNSIQLANPALNGLISDPNFLINNATHTMTTTGGNVIEGALNSVPRRTYDVMDTNRLGGLAAAIAGTSGFTPTQVIQATLDYAECQTYPGSFSRVILPVGYSIPISQILIWTHQELSGAESTAPQSTYLQHVDNTKVMIGLHGHTDTLTCPGLGTVTPGQPGQVTIKGFGINGMGAGGSSKDIGIELSAPSDGYQCVGCLVKDIAGGGNSFGGQGVLLLGISNRGDHIGYEDAQVEGCYVFTNGLEPVANSPTGQCAGIEDDVLDGEFDNGYTSDGAQFIGGSGVRGPGACAQGACAGFIFGGNNGYVNGVFSQISDYGMIAGGYHARFTNIRIDGTSLNGLRVNGGGHIFQGFTIYTPCTSESLNANFAANIPTNCFGVASGGGDGLNGGNQFVNMAVSINGSLFGNSYAQAMVESSTLASTGPDYFNVESLPRTSPNNTGPNAWPIYWGGAVAGGFPPIIPYNSVGGVASGATANISGTGILYLSTTTPLTGVVGGIPGQIVTIYAQFGGPGYGQINNVNNSGTSPNGIQTCSAQPIFVDSVHGAIFQYSLNHLSELGCDTQLNHSWINWYGNPTPTAPSFIDFYGNIQGRAYPAQAPPDLVTNLHGPTTSGSACFVLESKFPDTSHVVSPQACTSINIATLTPGGVFAGDLPQSASFNMYLVSNTQGNGVPLGKLGAPSTTSNPSVFLWDGPGKITPGGDGTQPAGGANDNNTGEFWAPFGVLLSTGGTQPGCQVNNRGLTWLVYGATGVADTFQLCEKTAANTYAWVTPAGGGGGGTVTGSGTIGTVPIWSTTSALANSHLTESGSLDVFSQAVQINDGTGFGGGTKGTEGTRPTGSFAPASGSDVWWASLADHWPLFNPNGAANDYFFVGMNKANTYTSGDCVQIDATLHALVDSGSPCGSGGGGSGYFIATAAAPAAASQTAFQQVAGVGRIQAYSANNTTVGAFSLVLSTADGTSIQSFPIQCTVSSCTFNIPSVFGASLRPQSAATSVACSTSGTVNFAEPFQGTVYKAVTAHLAACVGTASYTYPSSFASVPFVSGTAAAVTAVSSATTLVVNISAGGATTGFLKIEEQQ